MDTDAVPILDFLQTQWLALNENQAADGRKWSSATFVCGSEHAPALHRIGVDGVFRNPATVAWKIRSIDAAGLAVVVDAVRPDVL